MSQELKIALIGSAPSSIRNAPYHDESWQVWGCSPGAYGVVPKGRSNVWWELHRYEPGQVWFSPEYCQFLKDHPRVMVAEKVAEIPNGETLPVDELVKKYSPYFFTSSVAWMMAVAIEMGATKIGLWGIDMAATEEYEAQRSGLHYFALIAAQKGIEVGVPPESDLFRPRFLYGVDEVTHSHVKLRVRRHELLSRKQDVATRLANAQQEAAFIEGALDDLNYMHMTWADKGNYCAPAIAVEPVLGDDAQALVVPVVAHKRKRKSKGNGIDSSPVLTPLVDQEIAAINAQADKVVRDMGAVN